ncbi:MAG: hypothetical protein ACREOB_11265, partial [Thermodesulfobacteriota bacterium]
PPLVILKTNKIPTSFLTGVYSYAAFRTSSEDGEGFGVREDSSVATLSRNDKKGSFLPFFLSVRPEGEILTFEK